MHNISITLDIEELKKFEQLNSLPSRVLGYVAEQIEMEHFSIGSELVKSGESTPHVRFLLRGEIQFTGGNGSKVKIKAGAKHSRLPIPSHLPDGSKILALNEVTALSMPQELFLSIEKISHLDKKPLDEMPEDAKESSIFWAFHDSLKKGDLKLPSMPGITTRIAKVVNNPDTDSEDIARVIQADPTVAGRIISVVNSPAYRGVSRVDNLPDAVSRLGRHVTHNLVISFALSGLFYTRSSHLKKFMSDTWKHVSYVAAICHELARITPGLSPDQAMLCGLVHDIGVLPIIDAARAHPELLEDPKQLKQIIDNLKGEIGAIVLKDWGFSNDFIRTAVHADDWMEDLSDKPDYLDLLVIAQLHAYIGTSRMRDLPRLDLTPAFHKLALGRLTPRHSLAILENAKENIEELKQLLSGG